MAARRSQRSETLPEPLKLLNEIRPARSAITRACAQVRVTSDTYRALSAVLDAVDGLAKQLGHDDHFLAPLHKTP